MEDNNNSNIMVGKHLDVIETSINLINFKDHKGDSLVMRDNIFKLVESVLSIDFSGTEFDYVNEENRERLKDLKEKLISITM